MVEILWFYHLVSLTFTTTHQPESIQLNKHNRHQGTIWLYYESGINYILASKVSLQSALSYTTQGIPMH